MNAPIPPAPGPDWTFNAPPEWGAPDGFDPRRGHALDPTWPDPAPGWAFWTKAEVPRAAKDNWFKKIGWVRLGIGLIAVIFLVTRFTSHGPSDGVGSCWKLVSGTDYTPVKCSDSAATFKVVSETADSSTCDSAAGYLDSKKDGPKRYRCLESVSP